MNQESIDIHNQSNSIFTFSPSSLQQFPERSQENSQRQFNSSSKILKNQISTNNSDQKMSSKISIDEQLFISTIKRKDNGNQSDSLIYTPKELYKDYVNNQEDDEDYEGNNYMALTQKLQSALKKITTEKLFPNKTMGGAKNLMRRFQECEERKQKILKSKRQEIQSKKLIQIKQKPSINKNSQKIAKQTGYEPIHLRFQKIIEQKNKKFQINQQLKKRQEEQKELQFIQQYKKHEKRPENIRTYDQYFSEMIKWNDRRITQNNQKLQVKTKLQLEQHTFEPTLNKKSKKIAQSQERLPITERGLIKKKVQLDYNFIPNSNKNFKKNK